MHAQVTAAVFQPGRIDEAIDIVKDSILPSAREVKGFSDAYLLIDRDGSRGLVVSLWESKADVETLATCGFYQEMVAKVGHLLAAPADRAVYEVAIRA